MYVATGEFEVLFGDVPSLKVKRSLVRPLIAELRRRFEVACGEVGEDPDLLRRAVLGVAAVSNDAAAARRVVEDCEQFVARRPELDFLGARVRVFRPGEDFPV